jgi:hypothetical protein
MGHVERPKVSGIPQPSSGLPDDLNPFGLSLRASFRLASFHLDSVRAVGYMPLSE